MRIVVLQEGQQQQQQQQQAQDNVSLVMVSAKGRVAVYNQIQEALPLKLTSSFTLRLSAAPVAGLKGQSHQQQSLSSPSTTTAAAGRRGRSTPGSATSSRTYNNSQPVQKVFLFLSFFYFQFVKKNSNYKAHSLPFLALSPLSLSTLLYSILVSLLQYCM